MQTHQKQAPIFVVNLDRSSDRWKKISSQLDQLDLSYERISAVDGATLKDYQYGFDVKKFSLIAQHTLVAGEAGCSYSHIAIWRRIIEDKLPYAIVLEDDSTINSNFEAFVKDSAYRDFDYLKFDTDPENYPYAINPIDSTTVNGIERIECDPIPYGTVGYAISQKGASVFLSAATNMYYPVDVLPQFTFPYTKQGITGIPLVNHELQDSMIPNRTFLELSLGEKLQTFWIKLSGRFVLRKISVLFRSIKVRFL